LNFLQKYIKILTWANIIEEKCRYSCFFSQNSCVIQIKVVPLQRFLTFESKKIPIFYTFECIKVQQKSIFEYIKLPEKSTL